MKNPITVISVFARKHFSIVFDLFITNNSSNKKYFLSPVWSKKIAIPKFVKGKAYLPPVFFSVFSTF